MSQFSNIFAVAVRLCDELSYESRKILRDLRFKFKREARGLKFKSKISKQGLRLLKFKSEILKSALSFAIPARSKPLRI